MTENLTRDELLTVLGSLYTREVGDWELTLHHTLTEPTCPGATVKPENPHGSTFSGFMAMGDTIEEAIHGALLQAYEVLILRKGFEPGVPWTNRGDDVELQKIIKALDNKPPPLTREEIEAFHMETFGNLDGLGGEP